MKKVLRKWDVLTDEKRKSCINAIITFFEQERDEKIGILAAEEILDFMLQTIGKEIYNKGVTDSKETLKKNFEGLDFDLNLLLDL